MTPVVGFNSRPAGRDRQRLDAHVERIAELERKTTVVTRGCVPGNRRTGLNAESTAFWEAQNDVIAAAFACDVSRVFTINVQHIFMNFSGSWHQDVAHQHEDPAKQMILAESNRLTFQHVFLDLARKLDAIEDTPGRSVLDNSLIQWSQESGPATHDSDSIPIVTAGSAGGFFKTGNFVDYRRRVGNAPGRDARIDPNYKPDAEMFAGIPHTRWLATVLHAMGIPKSEWETPVYGGYGKAYGIGVTKDGDDRYRGKYLPGVLSALSNPLPVITAS